MGLNKVTGYLDGLLIFEPKVFHDERGFFTESYRLDELSEYGIPHFVQENHSQSAKGVFRGLHFQWAPPQGKLIRVIRGDALFVELDIRKNSPHLGKHAKIRLSEDNKNILWVPPGFANGFLALTDIVDVIYKCTAYWNGQAEGSIRWDDPGLGIDIGFATPILSEKDKRGLTLNEWISSEESNLFNYNQTK